MAREPSRLPGSLVIAAGLTGLSVAIRLVWLSILPVGAWSEDLDSWRTVAQLLRQGVNPYDATTLLNWPPLWMQTVFVLDHVSRATNLSIIRVIQLFLIGVDGLLTGATYLLLARHWRIRRSGLYVLVGLVLNPVAIILTVIHGNFDVVVGLSAVLFLWAVTTWLRHERPDDWLLACLVLGFGVLAKTTPIVLAPLLFFRWRRLTWRLGLLGTALVVGPAALGVSVIFTLGPVQVLEHVVRYHSLGGFFGLTGLANLLGLRGMVGYGSPALSVYADLFLALLALLIGALISSLAASASEERVVLATAGLLVLVPVIGPGFGPQYAWWSLAPLVVVYALFRGAIRPALLSLYVVAIATYVVDYGFAQPLGRFLLLWPHPSSWNAAAGVISTPEGDTLLRLPLFAACLAVLGVMARTFRQLGKRKAAPELASLPVPIEREEPTSMATGRGTTSG